MSAASETVICNRALQKLGERPIVSLTQGGKVADALLACYAGLRDAELRAHLWNFAMRRTTLQALAEAPAFGYARQFQRPADDLRPVQIGEAYVALQGGDHRDASEAPFQVEGRAILTDDAAPLKYRYVARVTDTTLYDPNFVEALACKLAIEVCETLTQSGAKLERLAAEHRDTVRQARRLDAIENPPEAIADDSWVLGRR